MFPKPDYRRQRRARKNLRKRNDRDFQSDGNPRCAASQETTYVICPACARQFELAYMAKHHIKGKATEELRYDEEFAVRLCAKDCHRECEDIGNKAFAENHQANLQMYAPHKYIILLQN